MRARHGAPDIAGDQPLLDINSHLQRTQRSRHCSPADTLPLHTGHPEGQEGRQSHARQEACQLLLPRSHQLPRLCQQLPREPAKPRGRTCKARAQRQPPPRPCDAHPLPLSRYQLLLKLPRLLLRLPSPTLEPAAREQQTPAAKPAQPPDPARRLTRASGKPAEAAGDPPEASAAVPAPPQPSPAAPEEVSKAAAPNMASPEQLSSPAVRAPSSPADKRQDDSCMPQGPNPLPQSKADDPSAPPSAADQDTAPPGTADLLTRAHSSSAQAADEAVFPSLPAGPRHPSSPALEPQPEKQPSPAPKSTQAPTPGRTTGVPAKPLPSPSGSQAQHAASDPAPKPGPEPPVSSAGLACSIPQHASPAPEPGPLEQYRAPKCCSTLSPAQQYSRPPSPRDAGSTQGP